MTYTTAHSLTQWLCDPTHVQMYGFTSARKMSSVLLRHEGRFRLYNKVGRRGRGPRCTPGEEAHAQDFRRVQEQEYLWLASGRRSMPYRV